MAFFVAGVDLNDLNVIERSAHRAGATHAAKGRQWMNPGGLFVW
jgi:hypothetical protein